MFPDSVARIEKEREAMMLWIARDQKKAGGKMGVFNKKPYLSSSGQWLMDRSDWSGCELPLFYVGPSQCEFMMEPGAGPMLLRLHLQDTSCCDC